MPLPKRHKIMPIIAIVYWLVLVVATHIPVPNWVGKTGFSDKTMHYFAYFTLTCLLWYALSPYKKINWRRLRVWLVLLVVVIHGMLDETLQAYCGRSADIRDFFADVLGILAGFAVLSFLSFPRTMLLLGITSMFVLPSITRSGLVPSAGLADKGINFAAYAFLTAGWIQYKRAILKLDVGKVYSLVMFLLLPVTVLICVKLFCIFRGRDFKLSSMAAAAAGILTAAFITFLWNHKRSK